MASDSPPLVLDASAAVHALLESDPVAIWIRDQLRSHSVNAPELLLYEAMHAFRQHALAERASATETTLALETLARLPISTVPFMQTHRRAWQLRPAVTMYDAAYVAAAELLDAPLLTLDARLVRAPGPRFKFLVYEPA